MSADLTIQNLIHYYEEKIRQIDRHSLGTTIGKEPQFPMLVFFLGDDATKGYTEISSNILQIWPQYKQEIKFVSVQKNVDKVTYYNLDTIDGFVHSEQISENQLSDLVSFLFGLKNHFRDRSKLLVYYILDTTSMISPDEYIMWLNTLEKAKELLGIAELDLLDMLIVLLNENLSRQRVAKQIRNCLCDDENMKCNSTFVLSNRRSDNAIVEDWNLCYRITSCVLALSNNSDVRIIQPMFNKMVLTASYAREEKPSDKIGQVIVIELIDKLSTVKYNINTKLLEEDSFLQRLGLTKEGTFGNLDSYIQKTLIPMLPTVEQLELFPRQNMNEQMMISSLSAKDFNNATMNTWDSYLALVAKQAQEKVNLDSEMRRLWIQEYSKMLSSNFTANELIYLKEHINDVSEKLTYTREPSKETAVLTFAAASLRYLLSSDSKLIEIFVDVIKEQGNRAMEFISSWNHLLESRKNIFSIKDENIIKFYERKVRNYFDHHEKELLDEFRRILDNQELEQFLKKTIDRIIESDNIFSAAFEDELERRIKGEEAVLLDAKQYIRQKLTGEDVYTYFQVNFSYGQPIVSSILLKVGTPLYDNLYNNLSPTTYYYDTGCSNAAEALNIYEVTYQNLINDERR